MDRTACRVLARRIALAVLLACGGLPFAATTALAAARLQVSHVNVSRYPRVTFQLHVTDPNGIPPASVSTGQFSLRDGLSPVRSFSSQFLKQGQRNTDVLLLIDTGLSTHGAEVSANKGASQSFISGLGPSDQVAVTFFDQTVHPMTTFTSDKGALNGALARFVQPNGRSKIFDALYASLQRLSNPKQKYAIILNTDGDDVHSRHSYAQCIALAKKYGVVVYTVALGTTPVLGPLRAIASGTGGQLFQASQPDQLRSIYQRLVLVFRHDYQFTYQATGLPHRGQHVPLRVEYHPAGGASLAASATYIVPAAPWLHVDRAPKNLGTVEDPQNVRLPIVLSSEDNISRKVTVSVSGWPGLQVQEPQIEVHPYSAGATRATIRLRSISGFSGGLRGVLRLHFQPSSGTQISNGVLSLGYRVPASLLRIANMATNLGSITDLSSGHRLHFSVYSTVYKASALGVKMASASGEAFTPTLLNIPSARDRSVTDETITLRLPDAQAGQHGSVRVHLVALTPGVKLRNGDWTISYYVPTWWERNWKWVVPLALIAVLAAYAALAIFNEQLTKGWDDRQRMLPA